jgi:hypothetical protein
VFGDAAHDIPLDRSRLPDRIGDRVAPTTDTREAAK